MSSAVRSRTSSAPAASPRSSSGRRTILWASPPPEWVDGQLIFRYNARGIALCTLALDDADFERYVDALFRWLGKARELWIEQVTSGVYGGLDVITRFVDPDAYEILTSAHPHLKPSEIFGS